MQYTKFYLREKAKKIHRETMELVPSKYLHFSSGFFLFDARNFVSILVTKTTFVIDNTKQNSTQKQIFM
jgi:hypothetical protein